MLAVMVLVAGFVFSPSLDNTTLCVDVLHQLRS